ncbi:MAG: hypothetical protein LKF48_07525 [Prevotella sp.]|jgi:hypothetical protein|nr:hypothetical protein [Prevotella sp.]MCH4182989.1 hypothetical protein [Prevotella sp.]
MNEEMANQQTSEATEDSYDFGDVEQTSDTNTENQESDTNSEAEPEQDAAASGDGDAEKASNDEQKEGSSAEEPFLKIRFDGADENLSRDEAISLAQKGRNYDKLNERYNALTTDPSIKAIREQAQRAGLKVEDYVQRISQFQQQSDIRQIAKAFKEKFPDTSDQAATAYAEQAYREAISQRETREKNLQQVQEQQRQDSINREISDFQSKYPDVDIENLPADVIEDINGGDSLMSAWRAHENRELKATLAAERKNAANRAKSVGSVNSNVGSTGVDDEMAYLIKGFENDD